MADINITTDFTQLNDAQGAIRSTDTLFVKFVTQIVNEAKRANAALKKLSATTQENLNIINEAEARVAAAVQKGADRQEKARAKLAASAEKEAQRLVAANDKVIASEVKLRAELERNAAKSAQGFQNQIGGNLGLGAQGISAGASAGAFEGEVERLRLKYDQVYASSQLYARSLAELNSAQNLLNWSTKKHEAAVEALNLEYQNFQSGVGQAGNRFAQHVNQVSTGTNRMGVAAQQSGYQISDFIVQVQGGTNPLVAFSQQATQMAGLLYLLPPAFQAATLPILGLKIAMSTLFMGVTIAIPLLAMLAMSFFGSGKEAKDAGKEVNELEERIKALDNALKDYLQTKKAESMGITPDELTSVDAMTKATNDLAAANAILDKTRLTTASGPAAAIALRNQARLDAVDVAAAEVARADALERINLLKQRSLDLSSQEAAQMQALYELEYTKLKFGEDSIRYKEKEAKAARDSVAAELRGLDIGEARVTTLMQQYDAQLAVVKALEEQNTATEELNRKWAAQLSYMGKTKQEAADLLKILDLAKVKKDAEGFNKAMDEALAAGVQFSLVDLSTIVALAAKNGWDLASSLQAAWAAAAQGAPAAASVLKGGGGRPEIDLNNMDYRGAVAGGKAAILEKNRKDAEKAAKDAAKGGSGGGANPLLAELETLQAAMMTQEMTQIESYARQQETLQSALEQRLITQQEYAALMQSTEMAHANEMFTIKQNETNLVREASRAMYESLGGLLQVFAGKSKAAAIASIALNKALAIASIIQNTAAAQMKAMFEMGPILGPPAAAKIGLMGKIQAGIVAATGLAQAAGAAGGGSVGGMGGGSGRGSAAVSTASAAPAPQTVFIDSLDPDGLYSGQALINLFDAFYDENDKRGKVFMVAR